MPTVGLRTVRV